MLVHQNRLYLFDAHSGIYVSGLQTPAAPSSSVGYFGPAPASDVAVSDMRMYVAGAGFLGDYVVAVLAMDDPYNLEWLGEAANYGLGARIAMSPPFVGAFGEGLALHDFGDPDFQQPFGSFEDGTSVYTSGVLLTKRAIALGMRALHVFDISQPTSIGAPTSFPIDTYLAEHSAPMGDYLVVATRDDRLINIDLSNVDAPLLRATSLIPGTSMPFDVAVHDGGLFVLSNDRGLQLTEPTTFRPIAEPEIDLPPFRICAHTSI